MKSEHSDRYQQLGLKISYYRRLRGLTQAELAEKIDDVISKGNGHIVFVIGGSLGLSKDVLARADYRLCFSKMTFPHKLMKLILLEQVYRAFKINNHETYHK